MGGERRYYRVDDLVGPVHSRSGMRGWFHRMQSDAGTVSLGSLHRLLGLAFALSVLGFVAEWIGDAVSSPSMAAVGRWTYFAAMALVVGTAVWVGARLVFRRP